jgi:hypothetical protein
MEYWEDLPSYWRSLTMSDMLGILWIVFMVLVTIASNVLFDNFIESKPAGRKTVLGKILK